MFSNLIGNPQAKAYLQNLIKKSALEGTFLFYGPEGVGKRQFALSLAQHVLGREGVSLEKLHPDVRYFEPVGKSSLYTIEQIKALVKEVPLPPGVGDKKFLILDQADRMLPSGANALLKTLEEPPGHAIFILITSQPERLLATIHSRAKKLPFYPIPDREIVQFLQDRASEQELQRISAQCGGSLRRALDLLEHADEEIEAKLLQALTFHGKGDIFNLTLSIAELDELFSQEQEEKMERARDLFEKIYYWFRDLHTVKFGAGHLFYKEHAALLEELSLQKAPALDQIYAEICMSFSSLESNVRLKHSLQCLFLDILA